MKDYVSILILGLIVLVNVAIMSDPNNTGIIVGTFKDPIVIIVGLILSCIYFTNLSWSNLGGKNIETISQFTTYLVLGFLFCQFFQNMFNIPHYSNFNNYGYLRYMLRLDVLLIISVPFLLLRFIINLFKSKSEGKSIEPDKEPEYKDSTPLQSSTIILWGGVVISLLIFFAVYFVI